MNKPNLLSYFFVFAFLGLGSLIRHLSVKYLLPHSFLSLSASYVTAKLKHQDKNAKEARCRIHTASKYNTYQKILSCTNNIICSLHSRIPLEKILSSLWLLFEVDKHPLFLVFYLFIFFVILDVGDIHCRKV